MKKSVGFVLSLVLIFSFLFPPQSLEAAVQSPGPKLRILEIVATGNSQLKGILGENSYEYTLMTMKKFVAQREELDGKYDVIAIMGGDYNSNPVKSNKDHNTTTVMNDITNLKANEIINDFIKKGQPVILSSKGIPKATKLKANFEHYLSSPPANVIVYDSNNISSFKDKATKFITGAYKQAPRFSLSEKPNESKAFTYDQNLDFIMNVQVPANISSRNLQAKLYIDSNFDDRYTTDEIVVEQAVASNTSKLSYKLPKGYSGVRYWKVELVDIGNSLKSYQKGMIHFVNKKVELKVLQVYTNEKSSLNKDKSPNNMNQSYLSTDEYKISIDATSMDNFNKSKTESSYSHEVINGKYDMVIFGFADSYNRSAKINDNAVASLEKFIASKQSIMFTHDTVFENDNNWVKHFMDNTGQISPQTNLGYGAPNPSTNTKKINEGLITTYPYSLNDSINVALTHNQYYTLNLEDDKIIPWYNIIGSSRDENDSWNHYYTYSKGNITYSGTGHRGGYDNFPVDEQKLFVNTMYRAFLGSNHAPEITVTTPTEDQIIPTNQNIELSYTLQDYDLKDKKLSTKVFLDGTQVYAENDVTNGATITRSIPHHLHDTGAVTIKIEAKDESGAVSEKEVRVKIQKINANLEVKRALLSGPLVEVGKPVDIEYTVTPKDITGSEALAISGNSVTLETTLRESFPANLVVTSDGNTSGSVATGITLEKPLSNIVYRKEGDKFVASPMTFIVEVTPTEKKQYVLANSLLRYKDFTGLEKDLSFNTLSFNADKALTDIDFPSSYVLNKGTEKNFKIDLKMLPADAGIKSISWSEESNGQILTIDPAEGTAKILKEGSTFINVKVTDVFGKVISRRVPVTVRIPVDSFIMDDVIVELGKTKKLIISEVKPKDEGKSSLVFNLADDSIASFDKEKFEIKGTKLGETILTATGINSDGNPVVRTSKVKVIKVPVTGIEVNSPEKMNKFEERKINYTVLPDEATFKDVIWSSSNSNIVEVIGDGIIKGVGTGTANVEITSKDNPDVKATIEVRVGQPLETIIVPEITLEKGSSKPIVVNYSPADATNVIRTEYFAAENEKYITVVNGRVHGVRVGKTVITVTVTDDKGEKHSKPLKVTVTPIKENVTDDKQDKY
ncbi:DUF5057 domain-containing protein [Peribacillus sp. NPDC097295]|uniref:DUF5057 domain-containing protein n=1 Tax=Peribacillus sp. NPDC097295 TaxID=3364402 RepID=UPI0038123357